MQFARHALPHRDDEALAQEQGAKDVVYVGENEKIRLVMQFHGHEGRYMIHCHNLVHEDHDMRHQFEVGKGGPEPINAALARPLPAAAL